MASDPRVFPCGRATRRALGSSDSSFSSAWAGRGLEAAMSANRGSSVGTYPGVFGVGMGAVLRAALGALRELGTASAASGAAGTGVTGDGRALFLLALPQGLSRWRLSSAIAWTAAARGGLRRLPSSSLSAGVGGGLEAVLTGRSASGGRLRASFCVLGAGSGVFGGLRPVLASRVGGFGAGAGAGPMEAAGVLGVVPQGLKR